MTTKTCQGRSFWIILPSSHCHLLSIASHWGVGLLRVSYCSLHSLLYPALPVPTPPNPFSVIKSHFFFTPTPSPTLKDAHGPLPLSWHPWVLQYTRIPKIQIWNPHIRENIQCLSVFRLAHSEWSFPSHSICLQISSFHYYQQLNNIPLCKRTTSLLCIHQVVDILLLPLPSSCE